MKLRLAVLSRFWYLLFLGFLEDIIIHVFVNCLTFKLLLLLLLPLSITFPYFMCYVQHQKELELSLLKEEIEKEKV